MLRDLETKLYYLSAGKAREGAFPGRSAQSRYTAKGGYMITAAELAGFFAAHAIWSVSDGATLIPILAYTTENDERNMERLSMGEINAAVEYGKGKLESNEMDANDAVLLIDGRIPIGDEMVDAIIIEIRAYFSPQSQVIFAVPYTPKTNGDFLVHKPKVLVWDNCEDFELDRTFESFFKGVDAHEEGSKIWNASLDQSK